MAWCPAATPTTSWPTSIRPSARPSLITSRAAVHPGRRGQRQDPGHLATRRLRARHRRRPAARRAGRHVHRQGRRRRCATRLAALGQPGVAASTFHAAALRQLRHFWPRVHGSDPPSILESKVPILAPLAAGLPGGYRFLAVRDLAGEIEWAKARRIRPTDYETRAIAEDRDASAAAGPDGRPLPPLRDGQGARRPDRLRGHARADDRAHRGRRHRSRPRSATAIAGSRSTSTRTPTRSRRRSSTRGSAGARTSRSSATRTRRSTRSPGPRATT